MPSDASASSLSERPRTSTPADAASARSGRSATGQCRSAPRVELRSRDPRTSVATIMSGVPSSTRRSVLAGLPVLDVAVEHGVLQARWPTDTGGDLAENAATLAGVERSGSRRDLRNSAPTSSRPNKQRQHQHRADSPAPAATSRTEAASRRIDGHVVDDHGTGCRVSTRCRTSGYLSRSSSSMSASGCPFEATTKQPGVRLVGEQDRAARRVRPGHRRARRWRASPR